MIKVGSLDSPDAFDTAKPLVELYAPERIPWVKAVPDAAQKKDMPNSAEA